MDMRRFIALVAVAGLVVGCSSSHRATPEPTTAPATTGTAVGYMHVTGGPPRRNGSVGDQPLPGRVVVRPSRAQKYTVISTVAVDDSGRFRITLPPGRYWLQGQPTNSGIMRINSELFQITAGHTTKVDLVEYAT